MAGLSRGAAIVAIGCGYFATVVHSGYVGGTFAVGAAAWNTIPVGIGIADTRYHPYALRGIVSRIASYTLVTGIRLLAYFVVVTLATQVPWISSWAFIAAATLAAAASAPPVLRRVQAVVNQHFNSSHDDLVLAVDGFGRLLRSQVDPGQIRADLVGVVRSMLQPEGVSLWMRERR